MVVIWGYLDYVALYALFSTLTHSKLSDLPGGLRADHSTILKTAFHLRVVTFVARLIWLPIPFLQRIRPCKRSRWLPCFQWRGAHLLRGGDRDHWEQRWMSAGRRLNWRQVIADIHGTCGNSQTTHPQIRRRIRLNLRSCRRPIIFVLNLRLYLLLFWEAFR